MSKSLAQTIAPDLTDDPSIGSNGDITKLGIDAVVNAANSTLLGESEGGTNFPYVDNAIDDLDLEGGGGGTSLLPYFLPTPATLVSRS